MASENLNRFLAAETRLKSLILDLLAPQDDPAVSLAKHQETAALIQEVEKCLQDDPSIGDTTILSQAKVALRISQKKTKKIKLVGEINLQPVQETKAEATAPPNLTNSVSPRPKPLPSPKTKSSLDSNSVSPRSDSARSLPPVPTKSGSPSPRDTGSLPSGGSPTTSERGRLMPPQAAPNGTLSRSASPPKPNPKPPSLSASAGKRHEELLRAQEQSEQPKIHPALMRPSAPEPPAKDPSRKTPPRRSKSAKVEDAPLNHSNEKTQHVESAPTKRSSRHGEDEPGPLPTKLNRRSKSEGDSKPDHVQKKSSAEDAASPRKKRDSKPDSVASPRRSRSGSRNEDVTASPGRRRSTSVKAEEVTDGRTPTEARSTSNPRKSRSVKPEEITVISPRRSRSVKPEEIVKAPTEANAAPSTPPDKLGPLPTFSSKSRSDGGSSGKVSHSPKKSRSYESGIAAPRRSGSVSKPSDRIGVTTSSRGSSDDLLKPPKNKHEIDSSNDMLTADEKRKTLRGKSYTVNDGAMRVDPKRQSRGKNIFGPEEPAVPLKRRSTIDQGDSHSVRSKAESIGKPFDPSPIIPPTMLNSPLISQTMSVQSQIQTQAIMRAMNGPPPPMTSTPPKASVTANNFMWGEISRKVEVTSSDPAPSTGGSTLSFPCSNCTKLTPIDKLMMVSDKQLCPECCPR